MFISIKCNHTPSKNLLSTTVTLRDNWCLTSTLKCSASMANKSININEPKTWYLLCMVRTKDGLSTVCISWCVLRFDLHLQLFINSILIYQSSKCQGKIFLVCKIVFLILLLNNILFIIDSHVVFCLNTWQECRYWEVRCTHCFTHFSFYFCKKCLVLEK